MTGTFSGTLLFIIVSRSHPADFYRNVELLLQFSLDLFPNLPLAYRLGSCELTVRTASGLIGFPFDLVGSKFGLDSCNRILEHL